MLRVTLLTTDSELQIEDVDRVRLLAADCLLRLPTYLLIAAAEVRTVDLSVTLRQMV